MSYTEVMRKYKRITVFVLCTVVIAAGMILALRLNGNAGTQVNTLVTADKPIKACDLLTQDLVAATVEPGLERQQSRTDIVKGNTSSTTCTYMSPKGSAVEPRTVILELRTYESVKTATKQFEINKSAYPFVINNLAEQAYWDSTLGQLHVLHKNHWLIVSAGPSVAGQRTPEKATTIAQEVIKKL